MPSALDRQRALDMARMSLWCYTDSFRADMWDTIRDEVKSGCQNLSCVAELGRTLVEVGYSKENATEVMLLAESYEDGELVDWLDRFQSLGIQGGAFITPSRKTISVAFRGSDADVDWKQNYKFWPTDYSTPGVADAKVHTGFYEQYVDGGDDGGPGLVREVVALAARNTGFKIIIGGHSLGAAVATIFAAELFQPRYALPGGTEVQLITLGSPRVFNYDLAKWLESRPGFAGIRVKNEADFFTRLPFLGFHHVGRLLWLKDGAARLYEEGRAPLESTWPDLRKFWDTGSDHELESYLLRLKRLQ